MKASRYNLTLFITGATPRSLRAISNVRDFCGRELGDDYDLEIVDLYEAPERAQPANIIVAPTLIRHRPKPVKLLVGDMSETSRLRALVLAP
ncbi:MAG: circadian clock KaiB family protein [Hyphomicrobiaceae bacterium]